MVEIDESEQMLNNNMIIDYLSNIDLNILIKAIIVVNSKPK